MSQSAVLEVDYATSLLTSWVDPDFSKNFSDVFNNFLDSLKSNKTPLLAVSVASLSLLATYGFVKRRNSSANSYPEFPDAHWFKGHIQAYRFANSFGQLLQKMNATFQYPAAYFRTYGGHRRLMIFSLKDLTELFQHYGSKSDGRFGQRAHMETSSSAKSYKGIVTTEGTIWKSNRKTFLNHIRFWGRQNQANIILEETKYLFEVLDNLQGKEIDPAEILQSAVCNVISTLIFESRFQYFDPEAEVIFQSILAFNTKVDMLPDFLFTICKLIPILPSVTSRLEAVRTTKKFIRRKIDERLKLGVRDPPQNLIEAYALEFSKQESKGSESDLENLVAVIYELFLAGTETTSTTLMWIMACLANNLEVQNKMFDEIESVVGSCELTPSHLRELNYTIAVQHEVQRFGCIAANTIAHRMKQDVKLSSGFVVRKNEIVTGALYSIMRNPDYWKYPEEFNPDNFLNEEGKFQNNEAFIPYGLGPRVCLGQSLADLELKIFLVELIRRYKITSKEPVDLTQCVQRITCAPAPHSYSFQLR